jgi:hypothetical protein
MCDLLGTYFVFGYVKSAVVLTAGAGYAELFKIKDTVIATQF